MSNHRLLKFLRAVHLYLGVFTAPALLFFAFTGALQSFDLHEAARGSGYHPLGWLQAMAHLHKKQSLDAPAPRAPRLASQARNPNALQGRDAVAPSSTRSAPAGQSADAKSERSLADRPPPSRNLLPMKIYFALVAASLFLSTLTGVYMASRFSRRTRRIAATLAAGVLVPLLLLAI